VFENRMLRIFGPKRDEVTRAGENYAMSFIALLQVLLELSSIGE
jgi:hypothetical protein